MNLISAKTPRLAKLIFSNYIWDVKTQEKELYLTFDDGPTPIITDWVLDKLEEYGAKATFFCIGKNIQKHPEILQRITEGGHCIGNHTFNHKNGWQTNVSDYVNNVMACNDIISESNIECSYLFRPPYGKITLSQSRRLRKMGYKILMWDVLSFDWEKSYTADTCAENVINNATPGSIIVFHDSIKASKNMKLALPRVLTHFKGSGYVFKTLG